MIKRATDDDPELYLDFSAAVGTGFRDFAA